MKIYFNLFLLFILTTKFYIAFFFQVRPCDEYKIEYKECKGIRSRFQQYFVYGTLTDCIPWIDDYNSCVKWEEEQDVKALKRLVVSETLRRINRFKPHEENDVWEKRKTPPENWCSEPPEWFQQQNANSYLAMKRDEEKQAKESGIQIKAERSFCVIS